MIVDPYLSLNPEVARTNWDLSTHEKNAEMEGKMTGFHCAQGSWGRRRPRWVGGVKPPTEEGTYHIKGGKIHHICPPGFIRVQGASSTAVGITN